MNTRALRRYIDDLLGGRRPKPFRPDDFEAAQIGTAIDLQAARPGADEPRPEFLADLHGRLAAQQDGTERPLPDTNATRRTVIVGTSAAAAAAVAGVSIDRALVDNTQISDGTTSGTRELTPSSGRWVRVAASADVPDGVMRPFDVGSVIGFVRRVDGNPEALSGVCTHQGCRLWFDAPDDRLRCPCHSTSFSTSGLVLTHRLPVAPKPLPTLMVREQDGAIEVFMPAPPSATA